MGFFAQNGLHFDAGIHGCLEYFGRGSALAPCAFTSATEEQMERLGALLGELQQSFAEDKKLLKVEIAEHPTDGGGWWYNQFE